MSKQMNKQYLEDFAAGQVFKTERKRVDKAEIFAFAKEYDPQPFHLDEEAARRSPFGGLAASGWHTAAMTMRLMVDSESQPGAQHHRQPERRNRPSLHCQSSGAAPARCRKPII